MLVLLPDPAKVIPSLYPSIYPLPLSPFLSFPLLPSPSLSPLTISHALDLYRSFLSLAADDFHTNLGALKFFNEFIRQADCQFIRLKPSYFYPGFTTKHTHL